MENFTEELQIKILIIEDNTGALMKLQQSLINKNYRMATCRGEQAIERIYREQPDIILLDLKLKNTTGLSVLKEIKLNQNLQSIPVIIISEICTPLYWEEAYLLGAAAYLVNPVHLNYLGNRISKLLLKRKQEIAPGGAAQAFNLQN
ncbi:two-component system, OmpR family, alkaline phosphatase synthesis response regulator PhoP [Saccharicrinis carchari]|uniref:Two-component system, OmpR family, alkaline phosphatase synthesis response regulator PhoP n=1 Tax=Saccharicrinis carchari TaxID=1168039 RepID=A0A521ASX9_SACCC|nr:response regulator [Saccharicrinis carchari]SMO37905.1 two-component system, OmpR family, alkaline phosphatase synthesis response regulator PhoP [Saccharicrinis carchari]